MNFSFSGFYPESCNITPILLIYRPCSNQTASQNKIFCPSRLKPDVSFVVWKGHKSQEIEFLNNGFKPPSGCSLKWHLDRRVSLWTVPNTAMGLNCQWRHSKGETQYARPESVIVKVRTCSVMEQTEFISSTLPSTSLFKLQWVIIQMNW